MPPPSLLFLLLLCCALLQLAVALPRAFASLSLPSPSSSSSSSSPTILQSSRRRPRRGLLLRSFLSSKGGAIPPPGAEAIVAPPAAAAAAATHPPTQPLLLRLQQAIEKETEDILSVYPSLDAEEEALSIPQWILPSEEEEEEEEDDTETEAEEGRRRRPTTHPPTPLTERAACIVIDPFSPFLGKYLKRRAQAKGLVCVDVLSPYTVAGQSPTHPPTHPFM